MLICVNQITCFVGPGHCSNYWNSNIPSRKRSLVQYHNLTFVEKLQKDLHDILQNEEATTLSECPDGNLIYYENGGNHEIGLGALLLKPPITPAHQESQKFKSDGKLTSSSLCQASISYLFIFFL